MTAPKAATAMDPCERDSPAPEVEAVPVVPVVELVAAAEVADADVVVPTLVTTVAKDAADEEDTDAMLELPVVEIAGVVLLVVLAVPGCPVMYEGAGLASAVSLSWPLPQAMALPSGCVAFGAGTVAPAALSIAKRVVQMRLSGSVEWEN